MGGRGVLNTGRVLLSPGRGWGLGPGSEGAAVAPQGAGDSGLVNQTSGPPPAPPPTSGGFRGECFPVGSVMSRSRTSAGCPQTGSDLSAGLKSSEEGSAPTAASRENLA